MDKFLVCGIILLIVGAIGCYFSELPEYHRKFFMALLVGGLLTIYRGVPLYLQYAQSLEEKKNIPPQAYAVTVMDNEQNMMYHIENCIKVDFNAPQLIYYIGEEKHTLILPTDCFTTILPLGSTEYS